MKDLFGNEEQVYLIGGTVGGMMHIFESKDDDDSSCGYYQKRSDGRTVFFRGSIKKVTCRYCNPTHIPANTCTPQRPGTGPQGKTCRDCLHYKRVKHHDILYPKCELMQDCWTHGPGSDIKAGWPACQSFEEKEPA